MEKPIKARKKRRVSQHIMESESYKVIEPFIPKEWVVRPFNNPDYGVDLVFEIFESIANEDAEALGEYLYVQVKSEKAIPVKKERIYSVDNVAKGEWKEDKTSFMEIDVIKHVLDTNTIYTVQQSGAGVAVILFVVDLEVKQVYFICLNDYIDKIILPRDPDYVTQDEYTITIPTSNSLTNQQVALTALKVYGKRAKMLAAFAKFHYQKNEMGHAFKVKFYPIKTYRDEIEKDFVMTNENVKTMLLYFIRQLEELDIWNFDSWSVFAEAKKDIDKLKSDLLNTEDTSSFTDRVIVLWHQLANIGTMYEDLQREWFLPKVLSLQLSLPDPPAVLEQK